GRSGRRGSGTYSSKSSCSPPGETRFRFSFETSLRLISVIAEVPPYKVWTHPAENPFREGTRSGSRGKHSPLFLIRVRINERSAASSTSVRARSESWSRTDPNRLANGERSRVRSP